MQTFRIEKGTTSKILLIDIYDSSSVVGGRLSGLVYNSAALTAYYNREGAAGAATAITLATATKGTWATGGFIAIDSTNMPGHYELHIPNAALATGANTCMIELKGASNMVAKTIMIELVEPAALEATLSAIKGTTFDTATDSLEALRNRGDAAWITATGFSTHSAADIWAVATRVLTAGTNIALAKGTGVTGFNDPTATENADVLLNRDMSAVSDTNARSPLSAFRFIRNKWAVAAGTLTVRKEDDTTLAWTAAVSTDATAVPIVGTDPA